MFVIIIISLRVIFYLEEPVEYRVFIKFYSRLTTVFCNKDYLPHLVTAGVVSPDSIHHLCSLSNRDRAMRLLEFISDSLEGGEKGCFYRMLDIMQEHGNFHEQNVAVEINKALVSGVDSFAKTYSLGSIPGIKSDSIGSVTSFRSDKSTGSDSGIGSVASFRSDRSTGSDSMASVNTSTGEGRHIHNYLPYEI